MPHMWVSVLFSLTCKLLDLEGAGERSKHSHVIGSCVAWAILELAV